MVDYLFLRAKLRTTICNANPCSGVVEETVQFQLLRCLGVGGAQVLIPS